MDAEKASINNTGHPARRQARKEDLATAAEVADKLRARLGSRIDRIILFGSRAKGIPKPSSDFDLFIVLPNRDRRTIDEIYDETTEYELTHGIDVSLKVYSRDALRRHQEMGTHSFHRFRESGKAAGEVKRNGRSGEGFLWPGDRAHMGHVTR